MTNDALARIEPLPPIARTSLPWDAEMTDPVAALAAARAEHGDTFVVDGPSGRTLFLFSPTGVRNFYALAEHDASKGLADWSMLLRKLPEELFAGRRTMPHDLFGRDAVQDYLRALDASMDVTIEELGDEGVVELFDLTRRIGHRMGLACWAGETPSSGPRFSALVEALDALDGSAAFVHPDAMRAVAGGGKRTERAAMATVEALIAQTVEARDAQPRAQRTGDLFDVIVERWADAAGRDRTIGIARDVILVHLGSMSNLFAATAWMIAHLALHPDVLERVRAGEPGLAERCALESTRLAQRSIMLRTVIKPVEIDDGQRRMHVEPGAQIATLLPLTNLTAIDGLASYDPDRWNRRHLADESQLAARELVTTFGHGAHTCPAQPFSLAAMCRTAQRLARTYALEPAFDTVAALPAQIGGVARSAEPCRLRYSRLVADAPHPEREGDASR